MNKVCVIAVNSFKEAIRDKVLFAIIFFGFIMLAASTLLSAVTVGEPLKVVIDMGLAGINIIGILISITVGISLVYREIEKKTIYTLLSKPLKRWEFLLGKYFGLVMTLALEVTLMTSFLFFILRFYEHDHTASILITVYMIFLELMVITSAAIFFSTFTSPFLSGMFTTALYIVGHITSGIRGMVETSTNLFIKKIVDIVYFTLPNLEKFNVKQMASYNIRVEPEHIMFSTFYAILYISLMLFLATVIFNKKDF